MLSRRRFARPGGQRGAMRDRARSPASAPQAVRLRDAGRGVLYRIGAPVLFWIGIALFGLSCLAWTIPAGVLNHVLPARMRAPLGQFMIMAGFRAYLAVMQALGVFRCDLRALDALRGERGLIIAANHPALLDAVLVISRLPRVVCITKASLWDNWFLGGSIRLACYIRNDAPVELIRRALVELRAGRQLLIFPEGTRTMTPPVSSFKGGFALMAQKANVPVQTVFIESHSPYLSKGWSLFRRPELPLIYRARLGRRFRVNGDVHEFVAELEQYFRCELRTAARGNDAV
jgi:1-acyl-sn-glycerol-3-phosphate acyltransferase